MQIREINTKGPHALKFNGLNFMDYVLADFSCKCKQFSMQLKFTDGLNSILYILYK